MPGGGQRGSTERWGTGCARGSGFQPYVGLGPSHHWRDGEQAMAAVTPRVKGVREVRGSWRDWSETGEVDPSHGS